MPPGAQAWEVRADQTLIVAAATYDAASRSMAGMLGRGEIDASDYTSFYQAAERYRQIHDEAAEVLASYRELRTPDAEQRARAAIRFLESQTCFLEGLAGLPPSPTCKEATP